MMSAFSFPNGIDIIYAIIIIIGSYIIGRIASDFVKNILKKFKKSNIPEQLKLDDVLIAFASNIIKFLIYVWGFLFALMFLGFSKTIIEIFSVALIFAILAVIVFSLKDFIPNAAAGVYLLKSNLINIGDRIRIDEYEGVIKEINLLNSILELGDKSRVTLPNSMIVKKRIIKEVTRKKVEKK